MDKTELRTMVSKAATVWATAARLERIATEAAYFFAFYYVLYFPMKQSARTIFREHACSLCNENMGMYTLLSIIIINQIHCAITYSMNIESMVALISKTLCTVFNY